MTYDTLTLQYDVVIILSGPEELGWDSAAAKPQPSRLAEGTPGMHAYMLQYYS